MTGIMSCGTGQGMAIFSVMTSEVALGPNVFRFLSFFPFSFSRPSLFCLLVHSRCRGVFVISFDHTQAHSTVGRTPLDEGPARRKDLYLTTQTLQKTNINAPGGIRTHNPSKRSAADLRFRPRDHWDRLFFILKKPRLRTMSMPSIRLE
jgi:hypothetical protein